MRERKRERELGSGLGLASLMEARLASHMERTGRASLAEGCMSLR